MIVEVHVVVVLQTLIDKLNFVIIYFQVTVRNNVNVSKVVLNKVNDSN